MLLTIRTTHRPATDLGYLLHKSPARAQSFDLAFGQAHVFYPEATEEACTAALLLEIDPVALVRGRPGGAGGPGFDQYVNDRPYVASSFTSVAIARVFGTALAGRSKERPELAAVPIPLTARLAAVPCRGGEVFLRRLFEPLGYRVEALAQPLDPECPERGMSRYLTVTLAATRRLADLLGHLYVLLPVLDDAKHYWVGDQEVESLLRHGGAWLASHPAREVIATRYLKHQRGLVRDALDRLGGDEEVEPMPQGGRRAAGELPGEEAAGLNELRLDAVLATLRESGARRVLDLGCGEGRLLERLLGERQFEEIVGLDVSSRALERAGERLGLDRLPQARRRRVRLLHGSLTYRDERLAGFDAAAVVEVVEHLDPPRLAAFERVLFDHARPQTVVLTTPNRDYNVRWSALGAGRLRHPDHRFEWSRGEFVAWAGRVAGASRYTFEARPVGSIDPEVGPPTQMGVFRRCD